MFDPARLVFIDETSANTKMVRLHGRCARGERLVGHVPQGHWKTITFVAALRWHGMKAYDRQSSGTQGCRCPRGDRSARRDASLSAQIFAGPEPDPFSKLKAHLRKAAERTIPRLRRRIGRFARTLTAREASNYFRHAGYA